jgi:hypothetical protein
MTRRLLLLAAASFLAIQGAWAQTAPPTRVRGTIAAVNGNALSIKSRDGQMLDIVLADTATVATVVKVALADIPVGAFIGTATRKGPDGKNVALEVLVFPEAMRGTGEGSYAWDLEPGSMMTNGTIKGAVTAAAGRELSIGFKDSSNDVVVPPDVPVVTFAPATRDDLKPGAPVFLAATKNAEGKLTAARVTVGTKGVAPPM